MSSRLSGVKCTAREHGSSRPGSTGQDRPAPGWHHPARADPERLDSAFPSHHNRRMSEWETPPGHRSGFIALAGRPNVGKSTLLNHLLGQSIAAVSPKPQTTRKRQLGILTLPYAQVIFIDTPGIHKPHHKLGERLNAQARSALQGADGILVMFDLTTPPTGEDRLLAEHILEISPEKDRFIACNKLDLVKEPVLTPRMQAYQDLLPGIECVAISSTRGDNVDGLVARIVASLPEGPRFYPAEDLTDQYERDIAADIIRATGLQLLRDEVPHSIAVRIDQYKDRDEHSAYIEATIFVERESQKGIVIGKGGGMLKQIGSLAREEIEALTGRKIYLKLRVKVMPDWRNDEQAIGRFGY
jgi:GTP-binding protein Era